MWKLSMDMADRKGPARRRSLRSAARFNDSATCRAVRLVKTSSSRSTASLGLMIS
jgi:hypothetical protein